MAMRRTRRAAVVAAAVLGALGFGGAGVAHAADLPLEVVVRLDGTAPVTGELVRGVRKVAGYAEATDGVARVDLYVVEHSLGRPLSDSVPVKSYRPSMPLGRAHFDFAWDSATTPAGLVDVAVVATTATGRTGEVRVISVRVEHVARQVTTPSAPKPRARAAAASAAKAAPAARAAAPVAPRRSVVRTALPPHVQAAQAKQASSFFAALAASEEAAQSEAAGTPSASARMLAPLARAGRGAWPSVAVGLILVVAAGHVQRAVRVQLAA
jgi:hypothetical protein